jgi:hypothetical protein
MILYMGREDSNKMSCPLSASIFVKAKKKKLDNVFHVFTKHEKNSLSQTASAKAGQWRVDRSQPESA